MRGTLGLLLALTFLIACRREETVAVPAAAPTATQTTGTVAGRPEDLSKVDVDTLVKPADPKLFVERARVGGSIGQDGTVSADSLEFKTRDPIYLTMWLKESPDGLQTSAHLYDSAGKELVVERKAMNGQRVATFKLAPKGLKPGTYRLVGNWGGNVATEYSIKVVK